MRNAKHIVAFSPEARAVPRNNNAAIMHGYDENHKKSPNISAIAKRGHTRETSAWENQLDIDIK